MKTLLIFVSVPLVLLTGCLSSIGQGSETEVALCETWGNSLPTRSRGDTQQTQDEIQSQYAAFVAVCPDQSELVP